MYSQPFGSASPIQKVRGFLLKGGGLLSEIYWYFLFVGPKISGENGKGRTGSPPRGEWIKIAPLGAQSQITVIPPPKTLHKISDFENPTLASYEFSVQIHWEITFSVQNALQNTLCKSLLQVHN